MEGKGHYEQSGDVEQWVWDEVPVATQAGGYTLPEPDFVPTEPEPEEEQDLGLEAMTKSELRDLARDQGVEGFSTMSKDELIEALS